MASRTVARKDFGYSTKMGPELPLSFGANFNDDPICRQNLRRSHTLGTGEVEHPDLREDLSRFPPATAYDFTKAAMVASSQSYGSGASGRHLASKDELVAATALPPLPPKQVDETVLRFLGYFKEAIPESPDERVRVRKVGLVYHCADGTFLLREASQVNSGLPQGVILNRQAVFKKDGSKLTLADLDIGATVDIFGKKVTLIECSAATRAYLTDVAGRPRVPQDQPWPSEEDTYNNTAQSKLQTKPKRALPTADFDHKRAIEAMRGSGILSKHAPDDVRTAQQFLRNRINEHLQFAAYWDERATISGDLRFAVIRYYIENDTIEIIEQRPENSGREGAAKILCRQRVAHPDAAAPTTATVQQNTYGYLLKHDYVTFDDLTVGLKIHLSGRDYTIYDADEFTRNWYKENRDVTLPAPVDITEVKGLKARPLQFPPPHNGWGSEDDSIRNCKSLLLKPPPIDTEKMKRETGKVMIFRAVLDAELQPEDVGREFVVAFHRATDEVEITERQLRNSGIVGGKFLAKGRHLKTLPDGRKVRYTPDDFQIGGLVRVAGRVFRLDQLDERSRRQLAGEVDDVSEERIRQLVIAFRELLNAKFYRSHEAYRTLAPEGSLTSVQLMEFFARSAGDITEAEANHLIHFFSQGDGTGAISFERFRKIMDPGNTTNLDEAANNARAVKGVQVFARASEEGQHHAAALKVACDNAADIAATRRLHKALAGKLVQRRGTVQESFRMLAGHAPNARLSKEALVGSLEAVLRLAVTDRERDLLVRAMFDTEEKLSKGLDFKAFYEFVDAA